MKVGQLAMRAVTRVNVKQASKYANVGDDPPQ